MTIKSKEKQIRNKIRVGERVAAVENIKYPFFECEGKRAETLCKKMNSFYEDVANKFSYHAHQKLSKKVAAENDFAPMKVSMNYHISLENQRVISVVLDLSYSRGNMSKSRRFSQMWSVDKEDILPVSDIIKTDRKSKKKIYSLVFSVAKSNSKKQGFGYFSDWAKRIYKNFDVSNFFATPKGLCYFVDSGKISPENYGPSGFVLPQSSFKDVVKYDFLAQDGENIS